MPRRVLVTRPEPGASQTAERLRAAGFSPILLPLSQTHALPTGPLPDAFEAIAVTSANAIRHASTELLERLADCRCYAVGRKTSAAAREAGFSRIVVGPGAADGLADLIAMADKPVTPILYLCGRIRLPAFEERLGAAGVGVIAVETYDTVEMNQEAGIVNRALDNRPVDAVMLYSARAADAFAGLASRPELGPLFEKAGLFCLSPRVASSFPAEEAASIHIATEPTEEALLLLLERFR